MCKYGNTEMTAKGLSTLAIYSAATFSLRGVKKQVSALYSASVESVPRWELFSLWRWVF